MANPFDQVESLQPPPVSEGGGIGGFGQIDPLAGGGGVDPGDIPPPPVPAPPVIEGTGVAGIPGTEGATFARPGTQGALPFRTAAFVSPHPPRFGPGVPNVGTGVGDEGDPNLDPERTAEILRALASGFKG